MSEENFKTMERFPQNEFELCQLVETFANLHPNTPIMFVTTDLKVCPHVITNHTNELLLALNSINPNIVKAIKSI